MIIPIKDKSSHYSLVEVYKSEPDKLPCCLRYHEGRYTLSLIVVSNFSRWTKFASAGLAQVPVDVNTTVCAQMTGFVTEQKRICESKPLVVPSIRKGVLLAMDECKKQLSKERWDCSTMTEATALKGLLAIREFLSALLQQL